AAPYVAQGLLAPLDPERLRYDVTFHMVVARSGRGNPLVEAFLEDLERAHHTPDTPA
ncbi:LysR family transcriptional regulator, partial [Burkholderia multivorans]